MFVIKQRENSGIMLRLTSRIELYSEFQGVDDTTPWHSVNCWNCGVGILSDSDHIVTGGVKIEPNTEIKITYREKNFSESSFSS